MCRFLFLAALAVGCSNKCDDSKTAFDKFVSANQSCALDSDCVSPPGCGAVALNRNVDTNTCAQLWSQVINSCDDLPGGLPACPPACDVETGLCTCRY
jgi:hypothetical protein